MAQEVLGALTRTAVGRQELENNLAALLKTKDFLLIHCKHLFLEIFFFFCKETIDYMPLVGRFRKNKDIWDLISILRSCQ